MTKNKEAGGVPSAVAAILEEARRQALAADGQIPAPLFAAPAAPAPADEVLDPAEILDACAFEPETDIGNGRRFLHRFGNQVRHVARIGWHGYDTRRWKEDEDGSVVRPLAQKAAEMIGDEARLLRSTDDEAERMEAGRKALAERRTMGKPQKDWDKDRLDRFLELDSIIEAGKEAAKAVDARRSARYRHAKSSAGTAKINNMMTEAAPHVALMVGDLNRDLYAVNIGSGTLRFERRENEESDPEDPRFSWVPVLHPHRPIDLISKLAPTMWAPSHSPARPVFDAFLKRIQPDPDIRLFLQRFAGYCLLGTTSEQCLVFFYGAGRNGKSTFVDLLCEIMGDYAVTLSIDSFAGDSKRGGNEATPDLARLPGARLVAASEPEMGVKLKDALIKTLTGGEKIPVRRLHQDFIEVVPQFKIMLSGNHKPRIDDTSDGIWRRVYLVPWDIQIPLAEVDRALPGKLRQEAAGVLAWMIEGALDYLNFGLNPPERVVAATQDYREESDPIGAFIRSGCIVTGREDDQEAPGELFAGYSNFAGREGLAEFKQNTFARRLPDYCRMSWKGPEGDSKQFWKAKSGTTVYKGIKVKPEFLGSTRPPPASPEQYGYDG